MRGGWRALGDLNSGEETCRDAVFNLYINGDIRRSCKIEYAVRTEVRPLEVHFVDTLTKLFILDTLVSSLEDEVSPPLFEGFCFGYDLEDLGFQFLFCCEEGIPEVIADAATLEEVCESWFVFSDAHYPVDICNCPSEEGSLYEAFMCWRVSLEEGHVEVAFWVRWEPRFEAL